MKSFKILGRRFYENQSLISILFLFFGLNWNQIFYILMINGLKHNALLKNIPQDFFKFLVNTLSLNFYLDSVLFKMYKSRIILKKKIGTYRGLRLRLGLPSRGQRTHNNARTAKRRLY